MTATLQQETLLFSHLKDKLEENVRKKKLIVWLDTTRVYADFVERLKEEFFARTVSVHCFSES